MWQAWRHHVWAAGILGLVGLGSIIGLDEKIAGTLGTRAFGYGALVLLGIALAIGPMARLFPRKLSKLIPYRRAMGIWSALAGGTHLLFALQLVEHSFYHRKWLELFIHRYSSLDPQGNTFTNYYRLSFEDHLTPLAWSGLMGLMLLVTIALVSNDRAQRFLGQATWKLIQQQAYMAFMFITLHVLIMRFGNKMKGSPPLLWWAPTLLLVVAGLQVAGFIYTIWKNRSKRTSKDHVA